MRMYKAAVLLYGNIHTLQNAHLFCEIAQMTVAIPCSGMDLRIADFFITVNIDTTSTSQGLKERRKSVCIMDALKLIVRSFTATHVICQYSPNNIYGESEGGQGWVGWEVFRGLKIQF